MLAAWGPLQQWVNTGPCESLGGSVQGLACPLGLGRLHAGMHSHVGRHNSKNSLSLHGSSINPTFQECRPHLYKMKHCKKTIAQTLCSKNASVWTCGAVMVFEVFPGEKMLGEILLFPKFWWLQLWLSPAPHKSGRLHMVGKLQNSVVSGESVKRFNLYNPEPDVIHTRLRASYHGGTNITAFFMPCHHLLLQKLLAVSHSEALTSTNQSASS